MQRLDRILAVIDPTVDVQVGAAKAARLARLSGASLELFACDFDPALTGQPFFDTDQLRRLREEFIAERASPRSGSTAAAPGSAGSGSSRCS
jgi:universal stress protein E